MKKIGIIAIYKQNKFESISRIQASYVESVEKAGGIVYLIPCNTNHLSHFIQEMDGFIFPGADEDVSPSLYGQENKGSKDCMLKNDQFLLDTFDAIYKSSKPVLGICKGHQIINVYFGGNLQQDIDDNGKHSNVSKYGEVVHDVHIQPDTFLYQAFQKNILGVNSAHHQCVDRLGKDLKISATSTDGYVEAIEHSTKKIYGFQWHPERMGEAHMPIFKKFIEQI